MPPARDEVDPGLPVKLEPCSNGEFAPPPMSDVVREAIRRARAQCEDNARRLGMSRRQFLLSTCGAATTLLAIAACSKESASTTATTVGGTFTVPPEATTDTTVASEVLGGDEPIIDVQNHLLEFDPATPSGSAFFGSGFPQAGCGDADPRSCFSTARWLEEVFLKSDTTMAVLSAIPVVGEGNPLSIEVMEEARRVADMLCGDERVHIQGHALPTVGQPEAALAAMEEIAAVHPIAAWKVYTHAGGPPWWLDDHDPALAQVGEAFLAKVEEIGVPIVSVHKGLGNAQPSSSPVDVGPAAAAHPDIAFVVYHSGFETAFTEGPFDPDGQGVDRLVATVQQAGIAPGGNVYAELGSTWRALMGSPDEAAHVLGKLLLAVGEDNVLWGTDSIWYGSPQDQIQAFRAFEITEELQERFGYPALTPARKAKILGGNAARLYGVDPATTRCTFDRAELEQIRLELPSGNLTYGPRNAEQAAAVFARDHPWI